MVVPQLQLQPWNEISPMFLILTLIMLRLTVDFLWCNVEYIHVIYIEWIMS